MLPFQLTKYVWLYNNSLFFQRLPKARVPSASVVHHSPYRRQGVESIRLQARRLQDPGYRHHQGGRLSRPRDRLRPGGDSKSSDLGVRRRTRGRGGTLRGPYL